MLSNFQNHVLAVGWPGNGPSASSTHPHGAPVSSGGGAPCLLPRLILSPGPPHCPSSLMSRTALPSPASSPSPPLTTVSSSPSGPWPPPCLVLCTPCFCNAIWWCHRGRPVEVIRGRGGAIARRGGRRSNRRRSCPWDGCAHAQLLLRVHVPDGSGPIKALVNAGHRRDPIKSS